MKIKEIYQKPEVEFMEMEFEGLMAASNPFGGKDGPDFDFEDQPNPTSLWEGKTSQL